MASMLDRLYPRAPVWAQNVGITLWGLGWRRERLGGRFGRYVQEFRDRDRWSVEQMRGYVEAEMQRVLVRAFERTSYYRRIWSQAGITAGDLSRLRIDDLPVLPATPKHALRAAASEFIADDFAGRRDMRRYCTCGTTGTPIAISHPPDIHRRFIAAREARSFGWAGTSLLRSRSMMGARLVVPTASADPPFHRWNAVERQVYLSSFHISPRNVPHYVEAIDRHHPEVLTGYVHSHYLLARMMLAAGLRLGYEPRAAILGSEMLTDEMRSMMSDAFRTRVYEEYGAAENCVLATECEAGSPACESRLRHPRDSRRGRPPGATRAGWPDLVHGTIERCATADPLRDR